MDNEAAVSGYLGRFAGLDDHVAAAAAHAAQVGVTPVDPAAGALLRWLTRSRGARTAVEIGAGGGTTGLWVLQGMPAKGLLTSIETEPDARDAARRAYAAAGVADHVRSILGDPAQVLPRLADDAYDLAVLSEGVGHWSTWLEHIARLLRTDGLLVAVGALAGGDVADPDVDDPDTAALRVFNDTVGDDPRWHAVMLPFAGGVLMARLTDAPETLG